MITSTIPASTPFSTRRPARTRRPRFASVIAGLMLALPFLSGGPATAKPDVGGKSSLGAEDASAPDGVNGVGAWVFVNHKTPDRLEGYLRPSWVHWLSAWDYSKNVHTGPGDFNWDGFDAAQKAAHRAGKPWAIMVIPSTLERGLAPWYLSDLPSDEKISISRGTFPAFWSPKANNRLNDLRSAIAARYGDDPLLAMVRVNMFWATHGEPWFEGGKAGRQEWLGQWRKFTHNPDATYGSMTAAYQRAEIDAVEQMAKRFPARIALSMATGFAFSDYGTATNPSRWGAPSNHPDRFATWSKLRHDDAFGARVVFQQNGGGDPNRDGHYDGARGFGLWLENSFGAKGAVPGKIGVQMVASVIKNDGRMDINRFRGFLLAEASRSNFAEIYEDEIEEAVEAKTTLGRQLRSALEAVDYRWP